jgi:fucose 4-O-acetylase-like acetyltransferase
MRLNYFDYFRGVAIILIVAGHSYYPWTIDTLPEMVIANLITGGTALFVFISGFFFHHVYYPKFQFRNFLIKKVKFVFLPYLILSSIAFILIVIMLKHPSPLIIGDTDCIANCMLLYMKYLWTGRILTAYWYVPFIMIIFAMSPLFIQYIKLSSVMQLTIFTILVGGSMLIQRPLENLSPIHSAIYFTPIYLLGIIYSINEKKISSLLKHKSLAIGTTMLGISIIQVILNDSYGNYHKSAIFSYAGFDLIIIQKIIMIFFFLSILIKIDNKNVLVLKYLASISFALYFLHPWFLKAFGYFSIIDYLSLIPGAIIFPIKTIFVIALCLTTATLVKKTLYNKSRYIIGY